ncbi:hypothetical protein [Scytonema sp. PCC 10023]
MAVTEAIALHTLTQVELPWLCWWDNKGNVVLACKLRELQVNPVMVG